MLSACSKVSGPVLRAQLSLKRCWGSDEPVEGLLNWAGACSAQGRPSGSPMPCFTPPTTHSLSLSTATLIAHSTLCPGGINDNLRSKSASLFVWVHVQRWYLFNKYRCVHASPILQLDSRKGLTLETYFCGSLSRLEILTDDRIVIKACILAHTLRVCWSNSKGSIIPPCYEHNLESLSFIGLFRSDEQV